MKGQYMGQTTHFKPGDRLLEKRPASMVGLPGLLARGGALWGGLPIPRPSLHFLYTLLEETFIIFAYLKARSLAYPLLEIRKRRVVLECI